MLRRLSVAALIAVPLVGGAFLRLRDLALPSFWLDEALAYNSATQLLSEPWWSWIIGFAPDHGPLLYALQLAGRFVESPELGARLAPVLFGIATIPLLWFAVISLGGSHVAAFCAAVVLATSPFHVYYSREARPYAISMLLAAAMLIVMVRRRSLAIAVIILVSALYLSGTSAPLIGAVCGTAVLCALVERDRFDWRLAVIAALCFLAVPLLYRGIGGFAAPADVVRVDANIVRGVLRAFTVSALQTARVQRTEVALLLFAVIGSVDVIRRTRRAGTVAIAMTVLPVFVSIALMVAANHWFAVRYLSAAIPPFAALVGFGIAAIARVARVAALQWVLALLFTSAIVLDTLPAALREPYEKLDWRGIATTISTHARNDDVVVTAEHWSAISLAFYLERQPRPIRHVQAPALDVAMSVLNDHEAAWLVSAGHSNDSSVSAWMCRFPLLLAAPHESFRLHYAPGASHFMASRSTIAEQRALASAVGDPLILEMGPEDDALLGEGWWMAEGKGADAARWAIGLRSSVLLPMGVPQDRVIAIDLSPLTHPTLPPQVVRVSLNGNDLGTANELRAPANLWREGANVLELHFTRTNSPASLTGSTDQRSLSALVKTITVTPWSAAAPAAPSKASPVRTVRLNTNLNQIPIGHDLKQRLDLSTLDRDSVSRLIARLGYDPRSTWPRLSKGEISLEEMAMSLVWSSACEDDIAFGRRAYAVLLQQVPNPGEEASLRHMIRTRSRLHAIDHIIQKAEFVSKLQRR